jgi:hypothetical protein
MHITKSILLIMIGVFAGIAFVISCGDIWHLGTNAAVGAPKPTNATPVCDCPAAQQLLAGRLVGESAFLVVGAHEHGSGGILCPEGALPVSGSCTVRNPIPDQDVILRESGFYPNRPGWRCSLDNNGPTQILYEVAVSCLRPPQ